jgi:hypothetical protein
LKINAAVGQLPDLLKKMRAMERRLALLEGSPKSSRGGSGSHSAE